jgi:hypothetical protein
MTLVIVTILLAVIFAALVFVVANRDANVGNPPQPEDADLFRTAADQVI